MKLKKIFPISGQWIVLSIIMLLLWMTTMGIMTSLLRGGTGSSSGSSTAGTHRFPILSGYRQSKHLSNQPPSKNHETPGFFTRGGWNLEIEVYPKETEIKHIKKFSPFHEENFQRRVNNTPPHFKFLPVCAEKTA